MQKMRLSKSTLVALTAGLALAASDPALAQEPTAASDTAAPPGSQPLPPAQPALAPQAYPPTVPQAYPQPYPPTYPQPYPPTYPQAYPQQPYPQTVPRPYPTYAAPVAPPSEATPSAAPLDVPRPCCLWSVRVDPFDLLARRATVVGEVALGPLPLSLEVTPKVIFGSPANELNEKGFDIGANLAFYPSGQALRGMWVKAHAEFESFRATLTRDDGAGAYGKADPTQCDADSAPGTCSRGVSSTILGLMFGSSQVIGRDGGFAISGGIGIGAALGSSQSLSVLPCSSADVSAKSPACSSAEPASASGLTFTYYDKTSRIRMLGTLSLGVTF